MSIAAAASGPLPCDRRAPHNDGAWRDDVVALIPPLRAFAWSLSHNASDADDLVQDTLIKAWSHRDKFEPGTNLRAWLFTILRNTYYTAVVRRRREVADEDGKHAATLSEAPTQDWSIAMRALQTGLQKLPPEHREALVLVGAAGLSYEEAAEICGCALGTIKSRVNRARARLLKVMEVEDAADALAGETRAAELQRPLGHARAAGGALEEIAALESVFQGVGEFQQPRGHRSGAHLAEHALQLFTQLRRRSFQHRLSPPIVT